MENEEKLSFAYLPRGSSAKVTHPFTCVAGLSLIVSDGKSITQVCVQSDALSQLRLQDG